MGKGANYGVKRPDMAVKGFEYVGVKGKRWQVETRKGRCRQRGS